MYSLTFTGWERLILFMIAMALGRYLFFAVTAYLICYKSGLKDLKRFKIQPQSPKKKQVRHEILFSLSTIIIFSCVGIAVNILYKNGLTKIYLRIDQYGWFYFFGSIPVMIILHDIYFYFTHRLLHIPWFLRNVHVVHHRSNNPTPLAAYCFHPVEAILESLIIFLFVLILPVNLIALLIFTTFVLLVNVLGHLGFEFFSQKFRSSRLGRFITSSTHHNLHHQKANKNFGYYFTWCDRLFNTLHKDTYN